MTLMSKKYAPKEEFRPGDLVVQSKSRIDYNHSFGQRPMLVIRISKSKLKDPDGVVVTMAGNEKYFWFESDL